MNRFDSLFAAPTQSGPSTLGKLNALPSSGKPVPDWATQDKAWANIATEIKRVAENLRKRP
jgi:hypothetical protein